MATGKKSRFPVTNSERQFWKDFAFVEVRIRDRYFLEVLHNHNGDWYILSPPLHLDADLVRDILSSSNTDAVSDEK